MRLRAGSKWYSGFICNAAFPVNSMQLYEVLSCQYTVPTKSVVALMHPPPREKHWNIFGNCCTCEWGLRLKLFNKRVSRATISVWEFLPFSETPVTCSALKWIENTEHRDLSDITFQHDGYSLSCHPATVLREERGRGWTHCCVDDWRLCARGCALPPVDVCSQQCSDRARLWVSVRCSFWILSWTLSASLGRLPLFSESSSEPRRRAASLRSPDRSTIWIHTHTHTPWIFQECF